MKNSLLSVIALAALTACSSVPSTTAPKVVEINKPKSVTTSQGTEYVDLPCAAFGKQAARIAELRDAKVAQEDVPLLLNAIADFPAGPMVREVYSRTDITPPVGARNSYETCKQKGYDAMVVALVQADAAFVVGEQKKISTELARKKKSKTATGKSQKR